MCLSLCCIWPYRQTHAFHSGMNQENQRVKKGVFNLCILAHPSGNTASCLWARTLCVCVSTCCRLCVRMHPLGFNALGLSVGYTVTSANPSGMITLWMSDTFLQICKDVCLCRWWRRRGDRLSGPRCPARPWPARLSPCCKTTWTRRRGSCGRLWDPTGRTLGQCRQSPTHSHDVTAILRFSKQ